MVVLVLLYNWILGVLSICLLVGMKLLKFVECFLGLIVVKIKSKIYKIVVKISIIGLYVLIIWILFFELIFCVWKWVVIVFIKISVGEVIVLFNWYVNLDIIEWKVGELSLLIWIEIILFVILFVMMKKNSLIFKLIGWVGKI